jgi:Zn-finger nucleic acid-binding protein
VPLGHPDPRDTVHCPRCAAANRAGQNFCADCGAQLGTAQAASATIAVCPGCGAGPMQAWVIGATPEQPAGQHVHGCTACGGVWVPRTTLAAMVDAADREAMARVGAVVKAGEVRRAALPAGTLTRPIEYRRCPACTHPMQRRNFGRMSGVIVDECGVHGTYFDAGELAAVIEFVRTGGLALARQKDIDRLQREQDRARAGTGTSRGVGAGMRFEDDASTLTWLEDGRALDVTVSFVRWAGRWVRNCFR